MYRRTFAGACRCRPQRRSERVARAATTALHRREIRCHEFVDRDPRQPRVPVRLRHRHRGGHAAARPERGRSSALISAKKNEPEWLLEWRLKAYPPLADDDGAALAERARTRPIDYQAVSYYSAPKTAKPLGSLDEVDPKLLETYDEARHPAARSRSCSPAWRSTRCSTRCRSARRTRRSWRSTGSSSARSARRCRSIPSSCRSTSARSCPTATTSSPRSTRRCSPTARSCTCRRACAARWSCRRTSASTRRTRASSSAR